MNNLDMASEKEIKPTKFFDSKGENNDFEDLRSFLASNLLEHPVMSNQKSDNR